MRLRFENNVYEAAAGQGWFKWGPTWARHKHYTTLTEFQLDLGIDIGVHALDPGFADLRQLDLRLGATSAEILKDSYPHGTVPGVRLGNKE